MISGTGHLRSRHHHQALLGAHRASGGSPPKFGTPNSGKVSALRKPAWELR
jgi:hypothetical protein